MKLFYDKFMTNFKSILFALVFILGYSISGFAQTFQSKKAPTQLLEVYSAEGCKDCIETEAWVSQFQNHPGLWKGFIPIIFSVTLWDRLGWTDPFGLSEANQRLETYRQLWQSTAIMTPTVLLNGEPILSGGDFHPEKISNEAAGVLSAKSLDQQEYLLRFDPIKPETEFYIFTGVKLGFGITSKVLMGDNTGKVLNRNFVVLVLRSKKIACSVNNCSTSILFPPEKEKIQNLQKAVVFWVSRPNAPKPIQSTGGKLS